MRKLMSNLNKNKYPYLFIAPAIILLFLFSIIPIFISVGISFTDMNIKGLVNWNNINFIGFENYMELFKDSDFHQAIFNTIFYVVIGVPFVVFLSMSAALLINYGTEKIFSFFRVVYYAPAVTNIVAVAVVWGFLYNTNYGLFNSILKGMGLNGLRWLQDPILAKISLIILAVWKAIGINMLIFLAALKGIPESYYEAARIDGAKKFQCLRYITLPQLKFSTFFVTITTLIGWIQFFEEPMVMTNGGPLGHTNSMALFIYQKGFKQSQFGYAASGSFILFIIIITITLIQFRMKKDEAGK